MNFEDYETLPTANVTSHMMAGAIAGVMEHCVMYPLDSVKTRMQNLSPSPNASYRGIGEVLHRMVVQEGVLRPVRGMGAVVIGAGPAHALYFSCYESLKDKLLSLHLNTHIASGAAGCVSTVLHDGIMTPADVVKQRLQMYNSPYKSVFQCICKLYRSEGAQAFFRSYTTTLTMNIPFQSIHFMTYEWVTSLSNPERTYNPPAHMVSGAVAGGVAAALTTPLDVCKTLLNTQQTEAKIHGMINAIRAVYRLGGPFGYFRGLSARVLYQMPSTAICWSTYEFFKYLLTKKDLVEKINISPESSDCEPQVPVHAKARMESRASCPTGVIRDLELPAVSGTGFYNALSFTTVHTAEGAQSSLLDITHR